MRALWNLLKNRLSLARTLSAVDWLCLVTAWWVLLWYFFSVRWASFNYLSSSLENDLPDDDILAFAHRLHRLVELASRLHLLSITCLPRALTLNWLLARRHISSSLRIGVAKLPSGMQAHAWVEVAGVPIGEAENIAERFTVLEHVPLNSTYTFSP